MTTDAAQSQPPGTGTLPDVDIKIRAPVVKPDYATIFGLLSAFVLIIGAIAITESDANFLNGPSFLIVVLGTMAATSVSFTGQELRHVPGILWNAMFRRYRSGYHTALELMDLSMLARKKGFLALSHMEGELNKDPFLARSVQLVTDGYGPDDIDRVLGQEVDALVERHRRSASIMRRGSEVAPAMGLIGTLVGLVAMLAQLDDPAAIGPAMAIALLTTFYGAILGTIVLAPLAAKLERNSTDEALVKNLILTAMTSIARQDNPRRLEMLLNSGLPPEERIRYFD